MWTVFEWCYDAWYVNPAFIFNLTNDGWLLLKRGMLVCRWYYLLPFVSGHWFSYFFFLPICDLPLLFFLFEISCIVNCFSQSAFVDLFEVHWQPPGISRLQIGYLWSYFASCYHALWRYFLFSTNKQTNKKNIVAFVHFLKVQLQGF